MIYVQGYVSKEGLRALYACTPQLTDSALQMWLQSMIVEVVSTQTKEKLSVSQVRCRDLTPWDESTPLVINLTASRTPERGLAFGGLEGEMTARLQKETGLPGASLNLILTGPQSETPPRD